MSFDKTIQEFAGTHFESSSTQTPQYKTWHRKLSKAFTQLLREAYPQSGVKVDARNHFDWGCVVSVDGKFISISIDDFRDMGYTNCPRILIRSMAHQKDWAGGTNNFVTKGSNAPNYGEAVLSLVARLLRD